MNPGSNYIEKNKELWNQRTKYHVTSAFYKQDDFAKGASSLNDIELKLLGNVKGKSILHLQCHFGQDSLSLARMGAHVTGVDLSEKAIEEARKIAAELQLDATFICCNIYDLSRHIDQQFDIVFTSYGVVGWLPDLDKWGTLISESLKPNGEFVIAEFHPVVWMFDNDFTKIEYRYFQSAPIIEMEHGTYADDNAPIHTESVTWNHGLAEVLTALISNGLEITGVEEYDHSPYNCFRHTEKIAERRYRLKPFSDKIPLVYSIKARKK